MKTLLLSTAFIAATALAQPAGAACYADYKAKRDNPLQLHYGVIEVPDPACGSVEDATPVVADRIGTDGWTLLGVLTLFGADGLEEKEESAGDFYLRY